MNKLKIILDTDIGTDCDDAGAMSLMHNLLSRQEYELAAVTSCSSRLDGAALIDIINNHYNRPVPVGMVRRYDMMCWSEYGKYSRIVSSLYESMYNHAPAEDAVAVLRKALSSSPDGGVILITIGPLNNIRDLMLSTSDDISPLTGCELVRDKVRRMYCMLGDFRDHARAEWNVIQDLASVQYVTQKFPGELVFVPFEVGEKFVTGIRLLQGPDNPVKLSYVYHNNRPRESWDCVTVYVAMREEDDIFSLSAPGKISVNSVGVTTFIPCEGGKHRYVLDNFDVERAQRTLDELIK